MSSHRWFSGLFLLLAGAASLLPATAAGLPQQQEVWPPDWFTDLPAVDLSGSWIFDPEQSDPMIGEWADTEVRYVISQHPAAIVLVFRAGDESSNSQTYRWGSTIAEFARGARRVQEAARWTAAGRRLEVLGRHFLPDDPESMAHYRFTYEARNDVLTFVQESESGQTVWRFIKERDAPWA